MAVQQKPDGKTHWSIRSLAEQTALSNGTVHRYLPMFGVQPHRSKSFRLWNNPFFIGKLRHIFGLYLNPPYHPLMLCVDEKSTVLTQCKRRPRHQEYLAFLRRIEANVPKTVDVHLIVDNYGTHKYTKVKVRLPKRPCFEVHFMPTYSSRLNQVERWFALLATQAICGHSFADLKRKIDAFVTQYNRHPKTFM